MMQLSLPPLKKSPEQTRVVVAMSGGVDSSVTAALLKEQGFDVVGMTLQLYDHGKAIDKPGTCCAGKDIYDARRVSEAIGIPHYVLDFEARFKEAVMEPFADSYLAGETPVPCVACNDTVKFSDLLERARELGADALVTGHYARRVDGPEGAELHMGRDHSRDQSYFLFSTPKDSLDFLWFPLGDMDKDTARAEAERLGLEVAAKPDSQDICFVPEGKYSDVVKKLRPEAIEPGDIVDEEGNVKGHHEGIIHYTVGQRKGLGISAPEPLYVLRLDPDTKQVVVGPQAALHKTTLTIRDVNWLGGGAFEACTLMVKLRSTTPAARAHIKPLAGGRAEVRLEESQAGISPGQACVFYDGDRVMGGGWIERD